MKTGNHATGERGAAVVLAMGVVALASVAASTIIVSQSVWSRQNQLRNEYTQAKVMLDAGVDWIRAVLNDDRIMSNVDHLAEPWAVKMPTIPVEKGGLAGSMEDQQGLFNLNNLVQDGKVVAQQLIYFKRLLAVLSLPDTLADALMDWLDSDSVTQSQEGAEDEYYLGLRQPYLAANRPLGDVAEIVGIRGFDSALFARLRPFVTALPGLTTVNVNTARAEVLAAMIDGLDIRDARLLVAERERSYFRDQADFQSRLPQGTVVELSDISVNSDYFIASLQVVIGDAEAQGGFLLDRGGTGWPAILWRRYR